MREGRSSDGLGARLAEGKKEKKGGLATLLKGTGKKNLAPHRSHIVYRAGGSRGGSLAHRKKDLTGNPG